MTILRDRQIWRRKPKRPPARRIDRLTPEQIENVRAGLRVLHVRLGTWIAVAAALGTTRKALERVLYGPRRPSSGHAMHVARVAGVPIEDVLSGAWPVPGACPLCGRCG